jgi:ABC-type bacteriocin/lantibiotic exporter with double-glycine peptidase domain
MSILNKLFKIVSVKSTRVLIILMALSIIASLLELGGITLLYPYLDYILNHDKVAKSVLYSIYSEYKYNSSTNEFLLIFGIGSILVVLLSGFIGSYSRILVDRYIWTLNVLLIERSFKKHLQLPFTEFKKMNSNKITNDIIYEVGVFINGIMIPIFDLLPRIFILSMSIIVLAFIDVKVASIIFSSIFFIYFFIFRFVRERLSAMSKHRFELQQALLDYVSSSIRAMKDIKVNNSQQFFIKQVSKPAKSYSKLNQSISIFSLIPRYVLESLVFCSAMIFLILNQSSGKINSLIPVLSLYAISAFKLIPHIQGIFAAFTKIKFNLKSLDIVYSNTLSINTENSIEKKCYNFNKLEISDIYFKYDDTDEYLLENISLSIFKNEFILFVGKSGSGKSTLIEIILGLIKSHSGNIHYNGILLTNDDILSTKFKLGYVSQDVILFEGSLKDNILLHNSHISHNNIIEEVINIACLDDVIASIGGSIHGQISEGGKNLSVGQRQRISIARSLFNSPDILFLDEATSALDYLTEKSIISNIKKLGITVILITHNRDLIPLSDSTYEIVNSTLLKLK